MTGAGLECFPWPRMMEIGLGQLRLSPKDFWAATPKEIAAAFGPSALLPRSQFDDMMKRFPD